MIKDKRNKENIENLNDIRRVKHRNEMIIEILKTRKKLLSAA